VADVERASEVSAPQEIQRGQVVVAAESEVAAEAERPVTIQEVAPARVRSRGEPVSSEPVLERVVVGSGQAQLEPEEVKPVRRGWWQRK
jgi:hypothetical protein